MIKNLNKIFHKISPYILLLIIFAVWECVSYFGIVPRFLLPSPVDVLNAFTKDFYLLADNLKTTLLEAILGLTIAVIIAFLIAFLMNKFLILNRAVYPVLIVTQTIPTIAIAPLLVLWMGYGILPKITLVIICCFFPVVIGLLTGFASADKDSINLLKSIGASNIQVFRYIKLPCAMPYFFSSLKIAVSYSVVGAVVAEWLGGSSGLGVYMIISKKSYEFDKMFAVILLISIISLFLIKAINALQKVLMPWKNKSRLKRKAKIFT